MNFFTIVCIQIAFTMNTFRLVCQSFILLFCTQIYATNVLKLENCTLENCTEINPTESHRNPTYFIYETNFNRNLTENCQPPFIVFSNPNIEKILTQMNFEKMHIIYVIILILTFPFIQNRR